MQLVKEFALVCLLPLIACQLPIESSTPSYLDIEAPSFFDYSPSPLRKPESLKQRPYYDFLSTLYRHDRTKTNLFNGYNPAPNGRRLQKREIVFRPLFHDEREHHIQHRDTGVHTNTLRAPVDIFPSYDDFYRTKRAATEPHSVQKRAIVFRPLFVYRQQQIKRETLQNARRRY